MHQIEFTNCCPYAVTQKLVWTRFTDRSRTAETLKMELFVTIVNCWKPLQTIVTKSSILDALDPDLRSVNPFQLIVALLYLLYHSSICVSVCLEILHLIMAVIEYLISVFLAMI